MAERSGLSRSTIAEYGRLSTLNPHLADTFKLSSDPLFVEKVYDVVGLYLNPPSTRLCCARTRSPRSRPSTGPSRYCR